MFSISLFLTYSCISQKQFGQPLYKQYINWNLSIRALSPLSVLYCILCFMLYFIDAWHPRLFFPFLSSFSWYNLSIMTFFFYNCTWFIFFTTQIVIVSNVSTVVFLAFTYFSPLPIVVAVVQNHHVFFFCPSHCAFKSVNAIRFPPLTPW